MLALDFSVSQNSFGYISWIWFSRKLITDCNNNIILLKRRSSSTKTLTTTSSVTRWGFFSTNARSTSFAFVVVNGAHSVRRVSAELPRHRHRDHHRHHVHPYHISFTDLESWGCAVTAYEIRLCTFESFMLPDDELELIMPWRSISIAWCDVCVVTLVTEFA